MNNSILSSASLDFPAVHTFKRRDYIPLKPAVLWQIRVGAVRLFTIAEDGSVITLGFWGTDDFVGQPLTSIQPCQIECLSDVEVRYLTSSQCCDLQQVTLAHVTQIQELIRMRHGSIALRLQLLLDWLATKFGCSAERGCLINLRLTHQQIAEAIGTSRVTVTRLLLDLERNQSISYSRKQCIILLDDG